jgi:hypothetical protein
MKFKLFLIILPILSCAAFAQTSQTPYSIKGIGEIIYPGTISNTSMGGISIAYPSAYSFNISNPALLSINGLTTFEAGFIGESRSLSNDSITQHNSSGNLGYLAICFPIKSGMWTSGFSLMPYSYVNYYIKTTQMVDGSPDTANISYKGKGGVNSVSWSNGFLFFKTLSVGLKVSYLFGLTSYETIIDLPKTGAYQTAFYASNNVRDINLNIGINYRIPLSKKYNLNIGGIYETANNLNVYRSERLERRRPDTGVVMSSDTILSNQKGSTYLPERIGLGLTLVKTGKWVFGLEYLGQKWSQFKNYYDNNQNLKDSRRYAAGFEIVPNINSMNNYFAHLFYRVGVSYYQTPYILDNSDVNELGLNFGLSLPVGKSSLVNLGFQFGNRDNKADIRIKENYFRISLGISYDDRWFIRRKIE